MLILKQSIAKYQSVDMNIPCMLVWAENNTLKYKTQMFRVDILNYSLFMTNSASFTHLWHGKANSILWQLRLWYSNATESDLSLGCSQSPLSLWQVHSHPSQLRSVAFAPNEAQQGAVTPWELREGAGRCAVPRDKWKYQRANNWGRVNNELHHISTLSPPRAFSLFPRCWSWPSAIPTVLSRSPSTGMGGLKGRSAIQTP